jgi:GNAT superfamily N-acetyltransferase
VSGVAIVDYTSAYERAWRELFTTYFVDDLKTGLPKEIIQTKICNFILDAVRNETVSMKIALSADRPIGFGIYQIDTPKSDWCKREGWGFIREFYIERAHRGLGCGRRLCESVELALRQMGAAQIYLTSDDAVGFWLRCGYADSGEKTEEGLCYLTKSYADG